jgi:hypothetical protein
MGGQTGSMMNNAPIVHCCGAVAEAEACSGDSWLAEVDTEGQNKPNQFA